MFDELFAAQEERIAAKPKNPIKVTLPDGAVKEGTSWETTPLDIAKSISSGLANVVVCAKVNGQVWDLTRRLEGDCTLSLLKFSDKEGKETYWHSRLENIPLIIKVS
jgi:threonyl-tRNA synthetase